VLKQIRTASVIVWMQHTHDKLEVEDVISHNVAQATLRPYTASLH
jgi:hypothetical protein